MSNLEVLGLILGLDSVNLKWYFYDVSQLLWTSSGDSLSKCALNKCFLQHPPDISHCLASTMDKANFVCVHAGCLQIACVILQRDLKSWFAELNVDIEKIQEIARYVINLFELWKSYDEKKDIQGLLAKMPKPKTQPSR